MNFQLNFSRDAELSSSSFYFHLLSRTLLFVSPTFSHFIIFSSFHVDFILVFLQATTTPTPNSSERSVNKEILSEQFRVDVNVENYFAIKKHFKAIIAISLTLILFFFFYTVLLLLPWKVKDNNKKKVKEKISSLWNFHSHQKSENWKLNWIEKQKSFTIFSLYVKQEWIHNSRKSWIFCWMREIEMKENSFNWKRTSKIKNSQSTIERSWCSIVPNLQTYMI